LRTKGQKFLWVFCIYDLWVALFIEHMIKLRDILMNEGDVYTGDTMSKNTSIDGKEVAAIVALQQTGKIYGRVIDYGCGKVDRNGVYLRSKGLSVYSYDPYWGTAVDGYDGISNILSNDHFDVGYTSYVLNVVNEAEQSKILRYMDSHCEYQYHVVRNMDVYNMVVDALTRGDKLVSNFYFNEFKGKKEDIGNKEVMMAFAKFGTNTVKGFQRIVYLEQYGYRLLAKSGGYKLYGK
jgi:hypothetical protein